VAVSIVTDASVDLAPEQAAGLGIALAPITYTVDGHRYVTGEQPLPALYDAIAGGGDVQVIGVEPGDFEGAFRGASEAADEIVCVCQSFGSTFTYVAAEVAARRVSAGVRIINTGRSGAAQAALAIAAARAARDGADAARVVALIENAATRADTYVVSAGLEQLQRSGALAAIRAQSSVGRIEDGVPLLRARGRLTAVALLDDAAAAESALVDRVADAATGGEAVLVVTHARAPEAAERLHKALTGRLRVEESVVTEMGPVLTALLGPGAYGAGFCMLPAPQ
jgi:DegV family protein with EDD domain